MNSIKVAEGTLFCNTELEPLRVRAFSLKNVKVSEVLNLVELTLTNRGSARILSQPSILVITDIGKGINSTEKLLKKVGVLKRTL